MNRKRLNQLLLVCLLGFLCLLPARPARAIVVSTVADDGVTIPQITAALTGASVSISNLTITNNGCASRNSAVGIFSQGSTPTGPGPVLGDVSGVVLGTGQLKVTGNELVSPNNLANWTPGYLCGAATSDADMRILEPNTSTGEYVAIEFDIVPDKPFMIIPFQFGSDEFPEYVCSAYNDIAGIFVSGSGITGPYSGNAQNYAKTANGDLTSINWVNTGVVGSQGNIALCGSLTNTAYYTDNSNGNTTGGNAVVATTNANLELDGWTNYLYQPIAVQVGQTYHVKAVVADAGDRQYDSAIFFHMIFSTDTILGFDFGDAPDTYQTLTANGGPRHAINAAIYLGATAPDSEVTGQPTAGADGDDTTGADDEDGVASFPALDATATSYSVTVAVNNTVGAAANLIGWIDFNRNGAFESGEGRSMAVANGTSGNVTLTWSGLSGLVGGTTYARFRLTTDPLVTTATPGGTAADGEVEDYTLTITSYDLGITKSSPNLSYQLWDTITYTVVARNNGPSSGAANNVGIVDTIPAEITGVTWTCVAAGGANCDSASGSGNALNTTADLPLNGTATYTISGTLTSLPGGGSLSNTASLVLPVGYPDSNPANNSATVAIPDGGAIPANGNKPLYLNQSALQMNRTPNTETTAITLATGGGTQMWPLSPVLQLDSILSPSVNLNVPVYLVLRRGNNTGNRSITVNLRCSSGGTTLTRTQTVALDGTRRLYTFNLPLAADLTCGAGNTWNLTVINNSGADSVRLYPYDAGPPVIRSYVNLPTTTVIDVASILFYSAAYPAMTAAAPINIGDTVYIRAAITDPFGSYDITGATLTLADSLGAIKLGPVAMTAKTLDLPLTATKIYETPYTILAGSPGGNWSALVVATEGTETPGVSDSGQAIMPVVWPLPLMTITKTADKPTAQPGEVVTYWVAYHNTGPGAAYNVVVVDTVPQFTTYVPGSLRMGNAASTYATALPALTDADDADAGKFVGGVATFSFGPVPANDGVDGSGPDEGKVYLQLQVN